MVNQLNEPTDLENRARAGVAEFIAEAICKAPMPADQEEYLNPEARLFYLFAIIGNGEPEAVHCICRLAWALHKTKGTPHWAALAQAKALLY